MNWDLLLEAEIKMIYADCIEKQVRIELVSADKTLSLAIVAHGVDDFYVGKMRLVNIVDRVNLFDLSVSEDALALDKLSILMEWNRDENFKIETKPILYEIREKGLVLLEIEPVYGAQVLILAKEIRMT